MKFQLFNKVWIILIVVAQFPCESLASTILVEDSEYILRIEDVENNLDTSPASFIPTTIPDLLRDFACVLIEGRQACSENCQQGKFVDREGCCTCVCRKNFVKVNERFCETVSWSGWSSWSKCITSQWGGLQTRERICRSSSQEAPGSCVGIGSNSRTCSPVTGDFRIRKNVRDLTDEEIHDLIQGMTSFKEDSSRRGFRSIVSWHGWPGECPWYRRVHQHSDGHCSWHHHPLFLPWHRLITVQLELGLSRHLKNKTLGIPFWDWTEHAENIPFLLQNETIYDPILKKKVHNPFYRTYIRNFRGIRLYSQRNPWYPGLLMNKYIIKGMVRALLCHNYEHFDRQEATIPHDQIHDCFCIEGGTIEGEQRCRFGMPTVDYAAWDPAFMLHHSAIDRMFVMRRKIEEEEGMSDWTKSRVIGQYLERETRHNNFENSFDFPLSPFCNESLNPESVTLNEGAWTLRNSYYGEQLFGYKYTDYNMGSNYTWKDLKEDYRKNTKDGNFWNDEFFDTKLGPLTRSNSLLLTRTEGCVLEFSNPV
uniref:hemocyanin 2-like n=1 Tax=Styela clava TaxID=7725 RepID=UPI00193962E4|nr:hemocyanin 2-like [Styela clava]